MREILLGAGELQFRLELSFAEARRFISEWSVPELLVSAFERQENRELLGSAVREDIHVGFILPGDELTVEEAGAAATRVGFGADWSVVASTVVARELGLLSSCASIPTAILSAKTLTDGGRRGFVEAFIPAVDSSLARKWVEDEVGTHVGLTLASQEAFRTAHAAFLAEGYAVASFMEGHAITNPAAGVAVIYYEKAQDGQSTRIEVLDPSNSVF